MSLKHDQLEYPLSVRAGLSISPGPSAMEEYLLNEPIIDYTEGADSMRRRPRGPVMGAVVHLLLWLCKPRETPLLVLVLLAQLSALGNLERSLTNPIT